MVREFKLPDVGEGLTEAEIVSWLVEVGDTVSEDQPVAEVETDKAVVDVPSPFDGTVAELRAEEGEMVPVGDVIVVFETDEGGDEPAETPAGDAAESSEPAETTVDADAAPAAAGDAENGEVSVSDERVFAPPSARREARERSVDITAVEGTGPSGRITVADVRDHAESTSEEPDGPKSVDIDSAKSVVSGDDNGAAGTADTAATAVETADRDQTLAAPATRRVADEEDVDLDAVPTDETRDGEAFVTAEQVQAYAEAQQAAQAADAAATTATETGAATATADTEPAAAETNGTTAESDDGVADTVAYRGVRRSIGEKMAESKYTAPHVTHHDTATVDDLVDTRERLAPRAERRDVSLTYMPFVVKAVVDALREFPILNSRLDEEDEQIVIRDDYHIGIAVATDAGLMVPVVEDADEKGLVELSAEISDLATRARNRELSPEELRGSTFTISNFGVFGGEYATPIINYPETAILGVGELDERAVAEDGEVRAAPTMPLSVSIDHRVVDGAEAAQFTNTVMERLESPELLLL